jgi:hypothetical protein
MRLDLDADPRWPPWIQIAVRLSDRRTTVDYLTEWGQPLWLPPALRDANGNARNYYQVDLPYLAAEVLVIAGITGALAFLLGRGPKPERPREARGGETSEVATSATPAIPPSALRRWP